MPETVASAPQAIAAPQLPRKVWTYVLLLAPLAGVVVALGVFEAAVFWPRDPQGVLLLALLAVLTGAAFALERRALVLHWRGQRTISSFDEPVVFLALALLPPAALVPLIAASMTLVQIAARRILVKAAFNVGTYAMAAGAGAAFAALGGAMGWPPAAGAAIGLLAYTFVSNVLTSALFADMESRSVVAVFRERFALATVFHVTLGIAIGVMLLALWGYHPLATLLVIPLALMTLSFMRLSAGSEREIVVHRKLAQVVAEIAGSQAADAVADKLLDACGDLFLAGRAELALDGRRWARDFEGGPAHGRAPTEAPILAHDGRVIGAVRVWPARRVRTGAHEAEPQILKVVASQVGVAMENAVAIEQLATAQDQQRGILENAPAGIAMLDAEGRVVRLNAHMRGIVDPLMADKALAGALEGLRKGVAFTDVEWCREGKCHLVSGVPLAEGSGSVVLVHDITERREAEEAKRAQSVTRPLVRRIILNLVGNFNATRHAIAEMGRSLAKEVEGERLEAYTDAFRQMGLGSIVFERNEGAGYRFAGDDLLERRPASLQPTCHLALGYLEGTVGKLHGSSALGSEVRCQSQGYARCEFVVMPRR